MRLFCLLIAALVAGCVPRASVRVGEGAPPGVRYGILRVADPPKVENFVSAASENVRREDLEKYREALDSYAEYFNKYHEFITRMIARRAENNQCAKIFLPEIVTLPPVPDIRGMTNEEAIMVLTQHIDTIRRIAREQRSELERFTRYYRHYCLAG